MPILTKVGLPNSCCICGKDVVADVWSAENNDMARSGQGKCAKCAKPKPAPKRRAKRKPKPKLVTVSDSAKGADSPATPDVFPEL
jgi:hypothetical protein